MKLAITLAFFPKNCKQKQALTPPFGTTSRARSDVEPWFFFRAMPRAIRKRRWAWHMGLYLTGIVVNLSSGNLDVQPWFDLYNGQWFNHSTWSTMMMVDHFKNFQPWFNITDHFWAWPWLLRLLLVIFHFKNGKNKSTGTRTDLCQSYVVNLRSHTIWTVMNQLTIINYHMNNHLLITS